MHAIFLLGKIVKNRSGGLECKTRSKSNFRVTGAAEVVTGERERGGGNRKSEREYLIYNSGMSRRALGVMITNKGDDH